MSFRGFRVLRPCKQWLLPAAAGAAFAGSTSAAGFWSADNEVELAETRSLSPRPRFFKLRAEEDAADKARTLATPKLGPPPEPSKVVLPDIAVESQKKTKTCSTECIIVVGTTGTGKSSTIAKYTGQSGVRVSSRPESQTRHCEVFRSARDDAADSQPVWIDTVGYDDTNRLSDQSSFQEVLRFVDDHELRDVRAIVWTVMPQERRDARLQKQAEFINQFREGEVWNNVVIVAKQPGGYNVDLACQGALEAAKAHAWENTKVRTIGFTYLDESIPSAVNETLRGLDPEARRKMLLVDDDDVYEALRKEIESIERPIQIIFRDSQCLDCGVVGDRRLLPRYCHFELTLVHPKPVAVAYHPEERERHHSLDLESFHPGVLRLEGGPHRECEAVRNVLFGVTGPLTYLDPTTGLVAAGMSVAAWQICDRLAVPQAELYSCCKGDKSTAGM